MLSHLYTNSKTNLSNNFSYFYFLRLVTFLKKLMGEHRRLIATLIVVHLNAFCISKIHWFLNINLHHWSQFINALITWCKNLNTINLILCFSLIVFFIFYFIIFNFLRFCMIVSCIISFNLSEKHPLSTFYACSFFLFWFL